FCYFFFFFFYLFSLFIYFLFFFFFFKQKTAYEITRRDWSSDVCSSDLCGTAKCRESPCAIISEIGRALPTIPTMRPTRASRPDESISIQEGAVPVGVAMVISHRPINLTSRAGASRCEAGENAAPDESAASM